MALKKKSKLSPEQSLIDYVKRLRQLNDIEVKIPQIPIEEVIKDPEEYAKKMIEVNFAKNILSYKKAYKLGGEFAKNLIRGEEDG